MIVGLSAAYYAKSRDAARELQQTKIQYQQIIQRQTCDADIVRLLGGIPSRENHCVFVASGLPFSKKNLFRIYVNADSSQATLLHVAYEDLPLTGYPKPAETYLLPKLGNPEQCRNLLRLDVFFEGKNIDDQTPKSFEGKILVWPYNARYEILADQQVRLRNSLINRRFLSPELVFEKDARKPDWFEHLLSNRHDYETIRKDQPTQILRFRTQPWMDEPRPGILLWLEVPANDTVVQGIKLLEDPS